MPGEFRVARRMIELSHGRGAIINPDDADLPGGGRSLEEFIAASDARIDALEMHRNGLLSRSALNRWLREPPPF